MSEDQRKPPLHSDIRGLEGNGPPRVRRRRPARSATVEVVPQPSSGLPGEGPGAPDAETAPQPRSVATSAADGAMHERPTASSLADDEGPSGVPASASVEGTSLRAVSGDASTEESGPAATDDELAEAPDSIFGQPLEEEDYDPFAEGHDEEVTEVDSENYLTGLLEALLFCSPRPVPLRDLARAAGIDTPRARELLVKLRQETRHRGVVLDHVASGFVLRTARRYSSQIHTHLAIKPVRLSRMQLETLAIVAYRQPVTKPEVDDIRGVDSGQVLRGLLERGIIKMLGKKDEPGRPMQYGTTQEFLELLSLRSLKDLPTLKEYSELSEESLENFRALMGEDADAPLDQRVSETSEVTPSAPEDSDSTAATAAPMSPPDSVANVGGTSEPSEGIANAIAAAMALPSQDSEESSPAPNSAYSEDRAADGGEADGAGGGQSDE